MVKDSQLYKDRMSSYQRKKKRSKTPFNFRHSILCTTIFGNMKIKHSMYFTDVTIKVMENFHMGNNIRPGELDFPM